jgi:hypothetical protein
MVVATLESRAFEGAPAREAIVLTVSAALKQDVSGRRP